MGSGMSIEEHAIDIKKTFEKVSKCSFLLELPFSMIYSKAILQSTEQGLDEQRYKL